MRLRDAWIAVFFVGALGLATALGVVRWNLGNGTEDSIAVVSDGSAHAADLPFTQPVGAEDPAIQQVSAENPECRLWNVLRPVDTSHETFWIGGWVEECGGVLGPVIRLGPEESREEIALRLENAVAQIDQLQNQLQAERTFASPSEPE